MSGVPKAARAGTAPPSAGLAGSWREPDAATWAEAWAEPAPTGHDELAPTLPLNRDELNRDEQRPRPEHAPSASRPSDLEAEFREFFERHHRELARLAFMLTNDHDAADDVTAEAFAAAWTRWETLREAEFPLAYLRKTVANMATTRLRKIIRERRGLSLLGGFADAGTPGPDVPAVVDVRTALMALPRRKRECVVLRYAFDLSEDETARALGVSVGTVKSQTSKGVTELTRLLRAEGRHAASGQRGKDGRRSRQAATRVTIIPSADSRSGPLLPDRRTRPLGGEAR